MAENGGFRKNFELISYHDLDEKPGFQMAMHVANDRWYLYLTGRAHPGWHIMDVTDPTNLRYVRFLKGPDHPNQSTIKIQVADGLMVTSLHGGMEGVFIWDVKEDPENPQLLSHWSTGLPSGSVHRFFYGGGRYLHLTSSCKGFAGRIYRILDIADPKSPMEVGRWWRHDQWLAGYTASGREAYMKSRHAQNDRVWAGIHGPPYVKGDLAYCGWGDSGMLILDISDVTLPLLVGQLGQHPPFAGDLCGAWCHTVLPLSQRPYAIMTSEGERFPQFTNEIMKTQPAPPMALFGIADVSDPANPSLISMFPYPEVPEGFPFKNFNDCGVGMPCYFGPHNLHEPKGDPNLEDRNDRIYCCYFHAGLRVYDISDPFVPKEIAYYIPPNPKKALHGERVLDQTDPTFDLHAWPRGPLIATTEDVIVDKRGNIFMDTYHDGLYVLRCTV